MDKKYKPFVDKLLETGFWSNIKSKKLADNKFIGYFYDPRKDVWVNCGNLSDSQKKTSKDAKKFAMDCAFEVNTIWRYASLEVNKKKNKV
jgi:hypothetical protein